MEEEFQDLKIQDNYDVNILLLGETGVGKSTFINSLANYLHHQDLETALKESLFHLIPCMFNITDENYRPQKVIIGSDDNEYQLVGDSATQDVRSYVFPIGTGKTRLRLIDSPGMGDPRGIEQDDINCENILSYIGNLHHLHAICLLFRPNDARITITFEYCVKQILSRLEKSAAKNIIFVFTNAKATHYKPGETIACLKKVVEDIRGQPPHVEIKVDDNVFCFDNEAFRYLAAVKKGIKFADSAKEEYFKSWANSAKEAWKLIKYIVGDVGRDPLVPHMVKSSKAINEARRIINQLAQPLADISQLILDNLQILDRRQKELQEDNLSLDELRKKLYVPVINLKVTNLTQPTTVCSDPKCAEFLNIDGGKLWNYKQRCHDPCYLKNVPQEIVGAPQLRHCAAMDLKTQTCIKCRCAQTAHMHIYYMTEKFDDKKIDKNVQNKITTSEKALAEAEKIVRDILVRKSELQHEKDVIIDCSAKFASFLQKNAITPFNDAYRKYINYIIFREKSLGRDADHTAIQHFQNLLTKYDQIKATFDKATSMSGGASGAVEIEAKDVQTHLEKLYALKHNGKKIKELYSSQKTSRKKEHQQNEYVHSSPVKQPKEKSGQSKTQSDVEGKTKKNKQDKMFKNYTQHGIHKNKSNQQNIQKKFFQNFKKKDNVTTSFVSEFGSKKQIKIEINEVNTKPEKKNNQLQNQQGKTKLTVLNNQKSTERNNEPQGRTKQQGNNQTTIHNNYAPPYSYQPPQTNQPANNYEHFYNRPPNNTRDPHRPPQGSQPPYGYGPPYDHRAQRGNQQPPVNIALNDNRPYDNRPPYDVRPPYDNRPLYDSRPPSDNRPPYNDRPPYESYPPSENRPPYESRPPRQSYPPDDSRPPYDSRPPRQSYPPDDSRPPYDSRPPRQNYPPDDSRPPYDSRPPRQSYPPDDSRQPYDSRPPRPSNPPPYDSRPSYENHPYDYRPAYENRHYDTHTEGSQAYNNRAPYDARPYRDYQSSQGGSYNKPYDNRPQDTRSVEHDRREKPTQRSQPPPYNYAVKERRLRRRHKNNNSGSESFKSCDDSD